MIIVMRSGATEQQLQHVVDKVQSAGFDVHISKGTERSIIGVKGASHDTRTEPFIALPGVEEVLRVLKPYKLASLDFHPLPTKFKVGKAEFGGKNLVIEAGPCSVEGLDMYREISTAVAAAGANVLRGGAFKPRSSPYAFQGLGTDGLKIMREVADELGLPVQTEVINMHSLDLVLKHADIIQIGARNMQNYDLLKEVGQTGKPVVIKRGMAASIQDLLMSAEYVLAGGNERVVLCERGIRTFETATRNTLDVSAVPVLKAKTHLPVVIDPSHASGHVEYVRSLALAGVAAGCDGLLIEVHNCPECAMSDGEQSLLPADFVELMQTVRKVAEAVGRAVQG